MSSDNTIDSDGPRSASELRKLLLEEQIKKMERDDDKKRAEEAERAAFAERFMTEHVTDAERTMIRRLVMNAVKEGKLEAMIYSFPSKLCTDGGRAINNAEAGWPSSLQGKAKELYERYEEIAKPLGYQLKAMIINFPGGMPGDVGFFLSWADPEIHSI
ncbi:MAG: histidine kinase [Pseudomonadota bacterium]